MRKLFFFHIIIYTFFFTGTLLVIRYSTPAGGAVNPWIGRFCLLVACLLHLIAWWARHFGSVNHRLMVFQSWLVMALYLVTGLIICQ